VPAGQVPYQPGIDGTEHQFSAFGPFAKSRYLVEHPDQLGTREIRVEEKACPAPYFVFEAQRLEFLAYRRRAPALPDYGVVDRLSGGLVPDYRRLALVGYTYGGNLGRCYLRSVDGSDGRVILGLPYFEGIVLDPARPEIYLVEWNLLHADDRAGLVEDYSPGRCRALIQGKDILVAVLH
jgi:hypothetical protein